MVSKTKKQHQKNKQKLEANGGVMPALVPSEKKSIHLKKTRPNMKGKMKIRLGLESPIDIYDRFEDKKGVMWVCPQCGRGCRVVGFCVDCVSGVPSRKHAGQTMSRGEVTSRKALSAKKGTSSATSGVKKSTAAKLKASTGKKMKFRVKQ